MLQRPVSPFYVRCFRACPLLPIRSEADAEAPRSIVERLESKAATTLLHQDEADFLYVVKLLLADYEARRPEYEAAAAAAEEPEAAEEPGPPQPDWSNEPVPVPRAKRSR